MKDKLISLLRKYKEYILYLVFGGLTTVIDWAISMSLYSVFDNVHVPNIIAWVAAVLFAYITNRIWVFESRARGFKSITRELGSFASGRLLTLGMQELIMFVLVDKMHFNKAIVKIVASVLVVILNYIISKIFVFAKRGKDKDAQ